MMNLLSTPTSEPPEVRGHRMQHALQVILADLDERRALSEADTESLRRELRVLLQQERIQIATAEIDKGEQVLGYMLRPNIAECLNLWMEEWDRVMAELASDDPLNAFHEIFHRHVAVIMRFGRFPHRNKILQRANTMAEEEFLRNSSFRFDMPLIRRPDGVFVFAGTVKKRTVKVLDHEYQSLLPDSDEMPGGAFEFEYTGPDDAFTKTKEQLEKQGYIRIGDSVPDFSAETSMGPVNFHEFIADSWCVLFSHPADFTPVCTTEFGVTAKLAPEWSKRGVKIIGLSVDTAEDHERWIADINETQHTRVNFPIIADKDRRVSMLFGMLDATTFRHGSSLGQTMTVRNVFIISPAKRVELILSYPAFIGRNFKEILRVLDALQLSAKYQVATPANWQPGDDTVVLPFTSHEA